MRANNDTHADTPANTKYVLKVIKAAKIYDDSFSLRF